MPIYEYECTSCKYRFEKRQNINDKPIEICPQCQEKVRKVISVNTGFILKGTGFHKIDYTSPVKSTQNCCGIDNPCENPKRCCQK